MLDKVDGPVGSVADQFDNVEIIFRRLLESGLGLGSVVVVVGGEGVGVTLAIASHCRRKRGKMD